MPKLHTDVLIIGGGAAACRAAIAACDAGAAVLIVSKRPLGQGGASTFPVAEMAGYNAGNPDIPGDIQKHYEDIISAGQGMTDIRLARILAEQAPDTVDTLKRWGVTFEQEEGQDYVFKSCFATKARTHVIKGHGEPMVSAMIKQIRLRPSIREIFDLSIVELIVEENRCYGAWAIDKKGEFIKINANAVVVATGGATQAFRQNLNPPDVSGDGYYLAYQAGAELSNMEFMQAGFGFSQPISNIFNGYIWAGHPVLTNRKGKHFLEKILPAGVTPTHVMDEHRWHFPFSSSDDSKYLEISVQKEIKAGNACAYGGIGINLSHFTKGYIQSIPDDCGIRHMWPLAVSYMKGKGVDLLRDSLEINVFAHAINGGILINEHSASTVEGLYAAGETAGGPHGADRLGGNMFVTCQVFGKIAGENAANFSKAHAGIFPEKDKLSENIDNLLHKRIDAIALIKELQNRNQDNLLICRSEDSLQSVLDITQSLKNTLVAAPFQEAINQDAFRLACLITATELMTQAALDRKESRGSHYREDYPEKDAAHNRPNHIKKKQGTTI